MIFLKIIGFPLFTCWLLCLLGCAGSSSVSSVYIPSQVGAQAPLTPASGQSAKSSDPDSFWDGDGVSGDPQIIIDLSDQMAYFFKGSQKVGVSRISSGLAGEFDTPVGKYKITQKNADHESNLYGDYVNPDGSIALKDIDVKKDKQPKGTRFDGADMPYFMRFHGGVGLHAGYLPGFKVTASHGCVRMPDEMARIYFENAPLGTAVVVRD